MATTLTIRIGYVPGMTSPPHAQEKMKGTTQALEFKKRMLLNQYSKLISGCD